MAIATPRDYKRLRCVPEWIRRGWYSVVLIYSYAFVFNLATRVRIYFSSCSTLSSYFGTTPPRSRMAESIRMHAYTQVCTRSLIETTCARLQYDVYLSSNHLVTLNNNNIILDDSLMVDVCIAVDDLWVFDPSVARQIIASIITITCSAYYYHLCY